MLRLMSDLWDSSSTKHQANQKTIKERCEQFLVLNMKRIGRPAVLSREVTTARASVNPISMSLLSSSLDSTERADLAEQLGQLGRPARSARVHCGEGSGRPEQKRKQDTSLSDEGTTANRLVESCDMLEKVGLGAFRKVQRL